MSLENENNEINENNLPNNDSENTLNPTTENEFLSTPIPEVPVYNATIGSDFGQSRLDLSLVHSKVTQAREEIAKYLIGQYEMVDLLLIGVFSGGHVLLEGVPGIAKTLTAKVLAQTLSVQFSRIQFTPDMMPSDIIGTSVFNMKTSDFDF